MKAYHCSVVILIAICVLVSTVCYIQIYGIVKQHRLQIHVQQQAVENTTTGNNQIENNHIGNNQKVQQWAKSAKNTFIYFFLKHLSGPES